MPCFLGRKLRLVLSGAAALAVCLSAPPAAQAQLQPGHAVLTTEHVDIGIAFAAGVWDLHLHQDIPDIEYATDEALLFVAPEAKTVMPANPDFSFIGAAPGDDIWILPQNLNPSLLFLGIAGEEIENGVFTGPVTLSLVSLNGPGNFSVWQTDTFGSPTLFMSTADGISGADSLPVPIGSHAHYNMGFTQTGIYEVTLQASGNLTGGGTTTSAPTTYFFGVETMSVSVAAPEAGTLALSGAGLFGLAGLTAARRRRRTVTA